MLVLLSLLSIAFAGDFSTTFVTDGPLVFSDKNTVTLQVDTFANGYTPCTGVLESDFSLSRPEHKLEWATKARYSVQLKSKSLLSVFWGLFDEPIGTSQVLGTNLNGFPSKPTVVDPATLLTTFEVEFPAAACDYENDPGCLDKYYFEVTAMWPWDGRDRVPEFLYEYRTCGSSTTETMTITPTLRVAKVTNPATAYAGVHPHVKQGEMISFGWAQGPDFAQCVELANGNTDGVLNVYYEDGSIVHTEPVSLTEGPYDLTWPVDERFAREGDYRVEVASSVVASCQAGPRAGEATPHVAFTVVPTSAEDYDVECHMPLYRGSFGAGVTFDPRNLEDTSALPTAHGFTSCGLMWRFSRDEATVTYDIMLRHCGALLGDANPVADIEYALLDEDHINSTYRIVTMPVAQEASFDLRDESPIYSVTRPRLNGGYSMYHIGVHVSMLVGPRDSPAQAAVSLRLSPSAYTKQSEWQQVVPVEAFEATGSLVNVHMDDATDLQLTAGAKAFASVEGGFVHPTLGHFTRTTASGTDFAERPFTFTLVEAARTEPLYKDQCASLMDVGVLRDIPQIIGSTKLCASVCAKRYGLSDAQPALRVGTAEDGEGTPVTLIVGIVAGVLVLCCCVASVAACMVIAARRRNSAKAPVGYQAQPHQHARGNSHRHSHRSNSHRGSVRYA
jgi:hypothetical protein